MRFRFATLPADALPLHFISLAERVKDVNWVFTFYWARASTIACEFYGPLASKVPGVRGASLARLGESARRLLAPSASLVRWVFVAWAGPYGGPSLVALAKPNEPITARLA